MLVGLSKKKKKTLNLAVCPNPNHGGQMESDPTRWFGTFLCLKTAGENEGFHGSASRIKSGDDVLWTTFWTECEKWAVSFCAWQFFGRALPKKLNSVFCTLSQALLLQQSTPRMCFP